MHDNEKFSTEKYCDWLVSDICVLSTNSFRSRGWCALLFTQTTLFVFSTQLLFDLHICHESNIDFLIEFVAYFDSICSGTLSNSFQIVWHLQFHVSVHFSRTSLSCTFQLLVASCHLFSQTKKNVLNLQNNNTHYWQFTSYYPSKNEWCTLCSMMDKMNAHFEILFCVMTAMVDRFARAHKKRNYKMLPKNAVYAKR